MQRDCEARAGVACGGLGHVDAVAARQQHLRAGTCRNHAGNATDRPGAAEDQHAAAFEPARVGALQRGLDTRDHRGGRRVGAARVGHQRHDEGLDHRRLRALEHVGREQRVAPADEDAGTRHTFRATREDRVLRQAGDGVNAHVAVRHDDLVAGVGRHVDVERAHLAARREHVQDVGAFHEAVSSVDSE